MKLILASASGVRKQILDKYNIETDVVVSNVDEDYLKEAFLSDNATPLDISKNLAEIKSVKVSNKFPDRLVLGADSVISLNNKLRKLIFQNQVIKLGFKNIYTNEEKVSKELDLLKDMKLIH